MKCHYEVLGVTRNATYDDIKAAYRRLALTWHPDKNLNNPDEAKKQFQRIKQAWDVLGDPHERTWYDSHREAILKGATEDYRDYSINLFPYFSTMCFEGYGDDENGFYAVYRTVFEKLVEEDAEFAKDDESEEEIPGFGDSQSSYEEVVHNFYAYWQSYSTRRSFAWLNPCDLRNASNRRVFRLAEKENRKVRDKAKRERNEQVRNLVAFIRKRDKRVQAHAAKLADRARKNARKVEERKKAQVLERQKLLRGHTESEWSKFSNFEAELRKIEATFSGDSDEDSMDESNVLYCIVCNKIFKTHKAYMNHENSRKHKENFSALETSIAEEEQFLPSSSFQEADSTTTESVAPNEPKLATDSQMFDFSSSLSENDTKEPDNEGSEDTSHDELISDDEENSRDCQSITQNESKLATDSQMPDFLMDPPENDTKQSDNENDDDTSHDELISDDEEKPKDCQPASEKEKTNDDDVSLTEGPRMNYNCFLCLLENGKEDNIASSEAELMSNDEAEAASDCQKKKKKRNRRKRRKNNVQNPNPVPDRISGNNIGNNGENMWLTKKQRKKLQQREAAMQNKSRQNNDAQQSTKSDNVNETITNKKKSKRKNGTVTKCESVLTTLELFHLFINERNDTIHVKKKEDSSFINMDILNIGSGDATLHGTWSF
ncbi:dnaJ homolog subfamily C member 21-like [Odontomachus brunneus]|uniref:dnaJ homolog subfamily C member 21-like n=1 Tax=Odontomachus brunneus TaxID=486640 RepID=UPI0013F2286E|nr:dnaJ homolog subfamily C member 21-like [Odontomachus brunneus]